MQKYYFKKIGEYPEPINDLILTSEVIKYKDPKTTSNLSCVSEAIVDHFCRLRFGFSKLGRNGNK